MGKPHDNASGRVRRIASHINQVSLLAETRHVVPDVQGWHLLGLLVTALHFFCLVDHFSRVPTTIYYIGVV